MGEFSGFALVPEQGAIPQKGQLDPDMQRRIEAMAARIDLSDNAAVMGFGARAQKEMGAFSDIALQQMLRQDIQPLESVMQTLAEQIKACSFTAQAKGLFRRVFGGAAPLAEVQAAYEKAIEAAGGIDLQILGIGRNGHIAFNEPADAFAPVTHVVDLTQSTIEANTRFFSSSDEVPRQALSMGIGSIMKAKAIVLIATGADKAEAVKAMITGPVTPQCPASILQLHPNVTIMLDAPAASLL